MMHSFTVADVKKLIETNEFHHASYRDIGTIWEGWHVYVKDTNGFNGFLLVGCIGKNHPEIEQAYQLLRNTGYSVGSYGNG